jgi:hypothetical protein
MVTLPDGRSPVMQMYLFFNNPPPAASPFPRRQTAATTRPIVFHEYTHGLSNRLITTATGAGALDTLQAAAMGEGWSDWYAKDDLVAEGLQPDTAVPGEIDMGAYVDASATSTDPDRGDRLPRPRGSHAVPGHADARLRGLHVRRPRPHQGGRRRPRQRPRSGAQTLWDLRGALGSRTAQAVITGGMRLSPPQPSFLEERNAIPAGGCGRVRRRPRRRHLGRVRPARHGLQRHHRGIDRPAAGRADRSTAVRRRAGRGRGGRRHAAGGAGERRRPRARLRPPDGDGGPLARPRARLVHRRVLECVPGDRDDDRGARPRAAGGAERDAPGAREPPAAGGRGGAPSGWR